MEFKGMNKNSVNFNGILNQPLNSVEFNGIYNGGIQ